MTCRGGNEQRQHQRRRDHRSCLSRRETRVKAPTACSDDAAAHHQAPGRAGRCAVRARRPQPRLTETSRCPSRGSATSAVASARSTGTIARCGSRGSRLPSPRATGCRTLTRRVAAAGSARRIQALRRGEIHCVRPSSLSGEPSGPANRPAPIPGAASGLCKFRRCSHAPALRRTTPECHRAQRWVACVVSDILLGTARSVLQVPPRRARPSAQRNSIGRPS
jgi:hypothetical protein